VCATAEVSVTQPTCFKPETLVLGDIHNAAWGEVTDPVGPNNYSVTATAAFNATFAGGAKTLTFEGILGPKLPGSDPKCQLTSFDLVLPAVSFTDGTCSANGSYTLGVAAGFNPAHLTWTVNGTPTGNGTYPVSKTTDLEIVAVPVAPHGLDPAWSNPVQHKVTVSAGSCGELTTLALTGSDGRSGLLALAGGVLLMGVLATVRARRVAVSGR
jgi:hypothetical protein